MAEILERSAGTPSIFPQLQKGDVLKWRRKFCGVPQGPWRVGTIAYIWLGIEECATLEDGQAVQLELDEWTVLITRKQLEAEDG